MSRRGAGGERAALGRPGGPADAGRQGLRHRRRHRGRLPRHPGPWRRRLYRGDRRRPAPSRCPDLRDLRGHQRHPGDRPRRRASSRSATARRCRALTAELAAIADSSATASTGAELGETVREPFALGRRRSRRRDGVHGRRRRRRAAERRLLGATRLSPPFRDGICGRGCSPRVRSPRDDPHRPGDNCQGAFFRRNDAAAKRLGAAGRRRRERRAALARGMADVLVARGSALRR